MFTWSCSDFWDGVPAAPSVLLVSLPDALFTMPSIGAACPIRSMDGRGVDIV